MKLRKLSAIFIAGALFFTSAAAQAVDVKTKLTLNIGSSSQPDDEAYTIEVPETVAITKSGWNELGSITVKYSGTTSFNTSKKLVVTATSTNNFSLASTTAGVTDTVSYSLATSENDTSAPTTFEFTAAEITTTGTSKPIGVIVTEYSEKSAGDYEDEITYSAEVQDVVVSFTVRRVDGAYPNFTDGIYTVAAGTTWQQFIDSGNAPACLSISGGKVWHDMNSVVQDCGGTFIANTADKKRVKPDDAIIDGATYACSDYLNGQDHD